MKEGTKAPTFSLPDQSGKVHKLSDYKDKKVILYFYPRDDTPGCTTEACNFRDSYKEFTDRNAVIIGVSKDTTESHQKFVDKYNLPFTLLSDPDLDTIKAYGAWGERSMYGKKYMGIVRSTVVIDENGKILKHFPKVSPKPHAKDLLKIL